MSLAGIAIRRPVATVMVMVSMVFLGIVSMLSMKSELLPNMNIPMVIVRTTWNGAVPEDINSQITKKIEDSLSGVDGIKKITSTSSFETSLVSIEFDYGVNIDLKRGDVQREIDTISGELPDDASKPVTQKKLAGSGNTAMMLNVSGPKFLELTTFVNEFMTPRFERIGGVGSVDTLGSPDKQIQIQFNTDRLSAYNLTPTELYDLIKASSVNIPLGVIKTGGKDVVARFMGEFNYLNEFENMILRSNGKTLRLKDVATVSLTTEDQKEITKLNGEPSVMLVIEKSTDGNILVINDSAKKALEEMKPYFPKGVEVTTVMDYSENINSSISGVKGNAVTGLVLATIVLFVFLKNVRATMLISLALPIAIVFTFAFLSLLGVTINVISLMGLSIGVGMLTDNSVVVIDNIYRHITELKKPVVEAAEDGASEVAVAILASALTTMVVFIPVLFIPGIAREIFRDMSLSIIFSNVAALIVSLTLMPMVASRFLKADADITKEGKVFGKVKYYYDSIIEWAIVNRKKTVGFAFGAFFIMMILGPMLTRTEFIPKQDYGRYAVVLELEKGLSVERAEEITEQAIDIVKKNPLTRTYISLVKTDVGIVNVDIGPKTDRDVSVFQVMDSLRPELSTIPGVKFNLKDDYQSAGGNRDVEFRISSDSLEVADAIAKQVQEKISNIPGIKDITSSIEPGNVEARVVLNRDKLKAYGISPFDIGRTISYSFLGGNRGTGQTLSVKTGTEEIDVLIRLSKEERTNISTLEQLNIRTADNRFVKVSDVADVVMAEGAAQVTKTDKIFYASVSANDGGIGLSKVQSEIVKAFEETNAPKGVMYSWGGMSQLFNEAIVQMGMALAISIFLIYAILASQFENFLLPGIILASVPLAMIGVYGGLILTNSPFDMMVMIGIIMLAGTVVNNAIVLIDFIKILRERGYSTHDAVRESCKTRLRPILMTTMTTVCGMIPLALGFGEGAELYSGMSVAVIFGLSFSTILTLVVIPVLYITVEEFIEKMANKLKRKAK
ncbi:efflux RND transporter permease subunit [uncultured Cetobacterium sp.]|uniref:efflux RND transporter permease subunit n=1 Tax=uncultured Cetobacterium sp. TaxID=527638 RepID=UPI00260EC5C6|nr:efflux RND transporter permease subunit [uncultured Cetobacterium sp.]